MTTTKTPTQLYDPVGLVEIADRLGVTLNTVHSWRTRARSMTRRTGMPDPKIVCSGTPLWSWPTIRKWAEETGRLDEETP